MTEGPPYREISAGFDRSASRYDHEVGDNPAMQYMRRISLAALQAAFRPGQRVLEIGCGTGEEAICLAGRGIHVLATDLSPAMLALTRRKVVAAGLEERIRTRRLAAGELASLADEYGSWAFDGAYSSFGPLNGEPDLGVVAEALATLIRSGGFLVVSVMNRFYPFEVLWYLGHGHLRQAVRRTRGKTLASVSPALSAAVPTWYYSPKTFEQAFLPRFRRTSCRALPLLLPPPSVAHLWRRFPRLCQRLEIWEERLADRRLLRALGDHFLMVLQREET